MFFMPFLREKRRGIFQCDIKRLCQTKCHNFSVSFIFQNLSFKYSKLKWWSFLIFVNDESMQNFMISRFIQETISRCQKMNTLKLKSYLAKFVHILTTWSSMKWTPKILIFTCGSIFHENEQDQRFAFDIYLY